MTALWLTVPEVAERLHISERTVRRLIREGCLPHRTIGRRIRVSSARLEEWAREDGDVRKGAAS